MNKCLSASAKLSASLLRMHQCVCYLKDGFTLENKVLWHFYEIQIQYGIQIPMNPLLNLNEVYLSTFASK